MEQKRYEKEESLNVTVLKHCTHTHINNTYYLYIHPGVRFFVFGETKKKQEKCFT